MNTVPAQSGQQQKDMMNALKKLHLAIHNAPKGEIQTKIKEVLQDLPPDSREALSAALFGKSAAGGNATAARGEAKAAAPAPEASGLYDWSTEDMEARLSYSEAVACLVEMMQDRLEYFAYRDYNIDKAKFIPATQPGLAAAFHDLFKFWVEKKADHELGEILTHCDEAMAFGIARHKSRGTRRDAVLTAFGKGDLPDLAERAIGRVTMTMERLSADISLAAASEFEPKKKKKAGLLGFLKKEKKPVKTKADTERDDVLEMLKPVEAIIGHTVTEEDIKFWLTVMGLDIRGMEVSRGLIRKTIHAPIHIVRELGNVPAKEGDLLLAKLYMDGDLPDSEFFDFLISQYIGGDPRDKEHSIAPTTVADMRAGFSGDFPMFFKYFNEGEYFEPFGVFYAKPRTKREGKLPPDHPTKPIRR